MAFLAALPEVLATAGEAGAAAGEAGVGAGAATGEAGAGAAADTSGEAGSGASRGKMSGLFQKIVKPGPSEANKQQNVGASRNLNFQDAANSARGVLRAGS